ncbi:MAG: helix-turn-helix domain-containing protein [Gammaproteobacteria bacterium]|nr:helix-turn-helix domain-containing protein [Gammaproteobacteria bacterium]
MSITNYGIGKVSRHTGCKVETIRYYESIGLLDDPGRTAGGHRSYSAQHIAQLNFIRRGRELGFSLQEVSELLGLAGQDGKTCAQVRDVTAAHLADVRGKIRDLSQMAAALEDMVAQCDQNASPSCPIIESLSPTQEALDLPPKG